MQPLKEADLYRVATVVLLDADGDVVCRKASTYDGAGFEFDLEEEEKNRWASARLLDAAGLEVGGFRVNVREIERPTAVKGAAS